MNETIASAALLSIVFIRLFIVACHETVDKSTISDTSREGASKDDENSSRSTLSNTSKSNESTSKIVTQKHEEKDTGRM